MTKDEALRLALEALELSHPRFGIGTAIHIKAVAVIKEALAEPEPNYKKALEVWLDKTEWVQETVKPHELGMHRADVLKQRIEATLAQPEHGWTPERIAGMARLKEAQDKKLAQLELEPVAWRAWVSKFPQGTGSDWVYVTKPIMKDSIHNQPLYTTPPQRTWVGLTDEEVKKIVGLDRYTDLLKEVVQYVEAKLRSKNNG